MPALAVALLVILGSPPASGAAAAGVSLLPAVAPAGAGGAAASLVAPATAPAPTAPPTADRRRENKRLVLRYLTEVLAAGRLEKLDEIVAKSFVDRSPGAGNLQGPAAVRQAQQKLRALFSKLEYDPQELIAEDDRVAARYLVLATPRAEGGGPTPPPLVLNGVAHFQIRDGRIQEAFVLNDQVGLLRQLGYTLLPPGARAPAAGAPAPAAPPAAALSAPAPTAPPTQGPPPPGAA